MTLRIITANVNGIRAAARKGFFKWLEQQSADVICLQETKAQMNTAEEHFCPPGYHCYFHDAEKKGYSGVAIYCRQKPDRIITGLGWPLADSEGRYIQADFGNLSIASLYMPSGTSGEVRQKLKIEFMQYYAQHLQKIIDSGRDFIICGDWNIAHRNIDLKNWKNNQKNSGFLPEERAWLDHLFDQLGYVDGFRVVNQEPDQYTWWTQRAPLARANNIGWRIDYQILSSGLKNKVKSAAIYTQENFSDHAPLIMDYDLVL